MYRRLLLCLAFSTALHADLKYDLSFRLESGSVRVLAGRDIQESATIAYKGDLMVRRFSDRSEMIDLALQTITDVSFNTKTHSITSFAEVTEFARKAQKSDSSPAAPAISVSETGKAKTIDGYSATELLVSVELPEFPPRMRLEISAWTTKDMVPGEEVRRIHAGLTQLSTGSVFGLPQAPGPDGVSRALRALEVRLAVCECIPLEIITRLAPNAGQITAQETAARLGRIGGLAGGLGALGRNNPAPAATPSPGFTGAVVEYKNFSTDPVSTELFEIPANSKRIPSLIQNALAR